MQSLATADLTIATPAPASSFGGGGGFPADWLASPPAVATLLAQMQYQQNSQQLREKEFGVFLGLPF